MKLRFYGADRCVTGSCHCLEVNGKHILVDCGLQQGRDEIDNTALPFHPGSIDVVLVTHAHIDHSGRIPMLIKNGFQGKIITTRLTADLLDIMLQDSAHIQEQDAEYQNRKNKRAGRPEVEPIYTVADALRVREFIQTCEYGQEVPVVEGVTARFIDAGHLLGSASIKLTCHEGDETRTVVFSGDIGNVDQPIIRDPQFFDSADYVLTESTYGDRNHEESTAEAKEAHLISVLKMGIARGGNIVIPSFAVGRTQELLYYIKRLLMKNSVPGLENVPVYIDSPLGINATKIYEKCAEGYYDEEAREMAKSGSPFDFPTLRVAVTADESKLINAQTGCNIIISSSGMCDAGRIRHHLKHNLWREDSTILFVGYQAEGTLGRMLCDGVKNVKLFGEDIEVNAEIKMLATGNPYIKEKMDLDIQVQKLRMLKSNFLSERYSLEDKVLKDFPRDIARYTSRIDGFIKDIATAKQNPKSIADTFIGMIVNGVRYDEKADAGQVIIDVCKTLPDSNTYPLGEYRGFKMEVHYEPFSHQHRVEIKGAISHQGVLGSDPLGNITRIDNVIDGLEKVLENEKAELSNTQKQLEIAKEQLRKPFSREDELKQKEARLSELNALLNVDKKENEIVNDDNEIVNDSPQRSEVDRESR